MPHIKSPNMLYRYIFLLLKEMLIIRYVETNLWLIDDLGYLHIRFYKNEKFLHSFIIYNKERFRKYPCMGTELQTLDIQFSKLHYPFQ